MVCDRCISVVTSELQALGISIRKAGLGEITLLKPIAHERQTDVIAALARNGFDILEDKNQAIIQKIKALVAQGLTTQMESRKPVKFSELISKALLKDYNTISVQFSMIEGTTLEKYIIGQRIAIVQDLLAKTDKSLTEISDELGYSSVSHLSRQLKSYTGHDVSHFKRLRLHN